MYAQNGKLVNNSNPYIIGICGGSGSGKTTFVEELRQSFSEEEMCVFSMDDYYKKREEQEVDENNARNFDLPTSINRELYHEHLLQLIAGETIEKEEYTFNNALATPKMKVFKPAKIILLEGLFTFHYKEIFDLMDLRIYVTAKDTNKIIRRIKRDRIERNYPLDDVLYRYEKHVTPTYELYIKPYRDDVDIIINNDRNFKAALELVKNGLKFKVGK